MANKMIIVAVAGEIFRCNNKALIGIASDQGIKKCRTSGKQS